MKTAALTELAEDSLRAAGATWMRREVSIERSCVRADVAAVVDGRIVLVEVKGETDSNARLLKQLLGYGTVADRVVLWCDERIAVKCEPCARSFEYVEARTPRELLVSPIATPPRHLRGVLSMLIQPEALALAVERGCARGVRGKSKPSVVERLISDGVSLDEASAAVARAWPSRDWAWFAKVTTKAG